MRKHTSSCKFICGSIFRGRFSGISKDVVINEMAADVMSVLVKNYF